MMLLPLAATPLLLGAQSLTGKERDELRTFLQNFAEVGGFPNFNFAARQKSLFELAVRHASANATGSGRTSWTKYGDGNTFRLLRPSAERIVDRYFGVKLTYWAPNEPDGSYCDAIETTSRETINGSIERTARFLTPFGGDLASFEVLARVGPDLSLRMVRTRELRMGSDSVGGLDSADLVKVKRVGGRYVCTGYRFQAKVR